MLRDIIKTDENFQYSVNLQYDLNDLEKINGYIPTNQSYNILKFYLESIVDHNRDKSTVLIGPYGKGKSHLMLVLLGLTYGFRNNDISMLIQRFTEIDTEFSKLLKQVQKRKLLPVIINSNYTDLNQAFLLGLNTAIERENLGHLKPNSYFEIILKTIDTWKDKFPETLKKFSEKLVERQLNINEFINRIKNYDRQAYKMFKDIYPYITGGAIFNPLIQTDVVKLYEEINYKLCNNTEFNGMIIIFDEFSKFIEASVNEDVSRDLLILQNLAELANRSRKNQMHLICITHKSINEYIFKLPKEKIDAWRAVEGRFKEVYFTSSSDENYELISNTIIRKKGFDNYYKKNKSIIEKILNEAYIHGLYKNVNKDIVGKGCFPLNPITTFALTRVSEKVAQNERTLFTFLVKDEKGSLARFIKRNKKEFDLLTIDYIYDYFEVLFKKESFDENIYRTWLKASSALKRLDSNNEKRIIKALCIIYIVNELKTLTPTDTILKHGLMFQDSEFAEVINNLIEKRILLKSKVNGFYKFLTSSDIDIKKYINQEKIALENKFRLRKTLENIIDLGYVIPKRYNNNYKMIRFYKRIFITVDEFINLKNVKPLIEDSKSDGIILDLIYYDRKEIEQVLDKFNSMKLDIFDKNRIVLCIPNTPISDKQKDEIITYAAIERLKNNKKVMSLDEYVQNEISIYEQDIVDSLNNYINETYGTTGKCEYYTREQKYENIKRNVDLNRLISSLCDRAYKFTPIINNELINKNNLTSPIYKARNKIVKYIFENLKSDNREILEGKGPEVTIYKAMIANKGLMDKNESHDENLNYVLSIIDNFIRNSEENKKTFKILYGKLTGEGLGLRKGIIPVYLAFILNKYKEYITIYFEGNRKELPLTVDVLNKINSNPNDYSILLEKGTNQKINYLNSLIELFKDYKPIKNTGYNIFSNIVESMKSYIRSLPKYTREFNEIPYNQGYDCNIEQFYTLRKELLKYEINPRELLMDYIPNRVFSNKPFSKIIHEIKQMKKLFDGHIENVKRYLIDKTREVFDKEYAGELGTLLHEWYNSLDNSCKKYDHPNQINELLDFIKNMDTHDEMQIISRLGRIVTNLNIEDWNDNLLYDYIEKIKEFKNYISNFKAEEFEVALSVDEELKDNVELSSLSLILYTELEEILEDYSDSVTKNEKRKILIKLLKKIGKESSM